MAGQASAGQARVAAANPDLEPGTSLGGLAAPGFQLVNQFGQPMSLSQFRGKVAEPSPAAARSYLAQLNRPLGCPAAPDTAGRLADG